MVKKKVAKWEVPLLAKPFSNPHSEKREKERERERRRFSKNHQKRKEKKNQNKLKILERNPYVCHCEMNDNKLQQNKK
jgi:hypothetical protein